MGVTSDVEVLEVELPDEGVVGAEFGEVAVVVGEGEADLDQMQAVHVGFQYGVK